MEAGDGTDEDTDEVLSFYSGNNIFFRKYNPELLLDMLYSGVLQLAQKAATQHGACLTLTAFWKNSMGTYHENGKVRISIKMPIFV